MNLMKAYEVIDCVEGCTVEELIEAAQLLLRDENRSILMTAPGRMGRTVEAILEMYEDPEEFYREA